MAVGAGEGEQRVQMFLPGGEIAAQPALLDQREARGHDMLQFIRRQSILVGGVDDRGRIGRAHAQAGPGQNLQRRQTHHQRQVLARQHAARDRLGILEAPLLQPQQGLPAGEIIGPGVEVVLGVEGDALRQHALGEIKAAELHRVFGEVRIRPRRLFVQAIRERDREAFLQHRLAFRPSPEDQRGADIVQRMGADLGVGELRLQRQRALAPGDGIVHLVVQHVKLGAQRIGHRLFGGGRHVLQHTDGLVGEAGSVRCLAPVPVEARQPAEILADLVLPPEQAPERDGVAARVQHLVIDAGGERAFIGPLLVKRRGEFGRGGVDELQRGAEVRGGLAVGAGRGGAGGGLGGDLQHGGAVQRAGGMMDHLVEMRAGAERAQGGEDAGVVRAAADGGDTVERRLPGDLVAEAQVAGRRGLQDALRGEVCDQVACRARRELVDQGGGHGGGDDADQFQQVARGGIEPGLARGDGLAHGGRRGGAVTRMRRDDFADLEGVAGGGLEQPLAGEALRARHLAHGFRGQRGQCDLGAAGVRQVGDRLAEGMVLAGLVAPEGDHQQHGQQRDPPAEEAEQVERGMVGPVQVFPDQQEGALPVAERVQQGGEEGLAVCPGADQRVDIGAEHPGHVLHRAERAGREQRVAAAEGGAPGVRRRRLEPADQRGLADAGFAGDEGDVPAPGPSRSGEGREQGKLPVALNQQSLFPRRHSPAINRQVRPRSRDG